MAPAATMAPAAATTGLETIHKSQHPWVHPKRANGTIATA